MFIIMILSYIIVAVLDTSKPFKDREYKKLAVYYSLMLISITIGTMIGMGIKVPSPAGPIEQMVNAMIGK